LLFLSVFVPELHRHAEGWSRMTSSAILEGQVAAKRSLPVVTSETRRTACCNEMLRRRG
jgi:hypothetical protein